MKAKTIIALATLLAFGQGAWADGTTSFPLHYNAETNPEDGSEAHPYQIQSVSDLNTLASDVNSGTAYSGKHFILTADLDYSGVALFDTDEDGEADSNFTPIGYQAFDDSDAPDYENSRPFKGTFNGNSKTISGLTISGVADLGIFGFIHGATIKNLTVDQSSITGSTCLGGIAGEAYSGEFLIDNCYVTGNVTIDGGNEGYLVGGIIGYGQTGTIKDCISAATVKGDEAIGGIAGSFGDEAAMSTKSCVDCYYSANSVTGTKSYGAIIGDNSGIDFAITLLDNDSEAAINNATRLSNYDGLVANVTLSGRTLYKDNSWNTICLPFAMTAAQVTAQLAPTKLMTLSTATFAEGTLTLNFADATEIEACKPYIIKWTGNTEWGNPTFEGVTVSSAAPTDVEGTAANFHGIYSPYSTGGENKSMLYLGASNKLYYPSADMTINAFRAYFTLNGIEAGPASSSAPAAARAFVLNFGDGDGATGILSLSADSKDSKDNAAWYDMQGRHLSGKPTASGIYINSGNKVVIK